MSWNLVFDQGLALWAGLNVIPKTTYLATYSHSVAPKMNERFRTAWIATLQREKLLGGKSFNVDFHTVPYFGEDEFVERQAQDADSQNGVGLI
jgi:hypothetical protein